MKKGFYYFLFVMVVSGGLVLYYKIERDEKMKNPNLTDLAVEPDLLMSTADRNFHDYKDLTAIKFLEDAITTMKILEKDGDSVSIEAIEIAIHDLKVVEEHIKSEDINDDFMYEAFADAMNSMAYASLRFSEKFIKEGKNEEAKVTIDHAMDHLQNSIRFARGEQKEDEIRIAGHLQRIIENHWENDISQIDVVMVEIDSVVKAHVIQ
ncbi:MAG: hypothetical protein OXH57_06040 [Ekhidna sp.]|nr:hypothetical protein [Ekhidna sp.]